MGNNKNKHKKVAKCKVRKVRREISASKTRLRGMYVTNKNTNIKRSLQNEQILQEKTICDLDAVPATNMKETKSMQNEQILPVKSICDLDAIPATNVKETNHLVETWCNIDKSSQLQGHEEIHESDKVSHSSKVIEQQCKQIKDISNKNTRKRKFTDVNNHNNKDKEKTESVNVLWDLPCEVATQGEQIEKIKDGNNRIVDFKYFTEELMRISSHKSLFQCSFNTMELISERKHGEMGKRKEKYYKKKVGANFRKKKKTKNIPLHDALAVEVQQQDETRVNKALKDVVQSERDLKRYLIDLPKPSASLIIGSDSPADAATVHQSAEVQIQQEEKIPQVCPKCYSELPACFLATQTQHKQVRSIIAKVYHFLEREYEQLKSLHPETDWSPLSRVRQRAAVATGVSEPDVLHILSEEADTRAADEDPPRKRPRTENQSEYDDVNEAEQIEEALHEPDVYVATKPALEPNPLEDSEDETIIIKEEQDDNITYYTVMEAVSAPEETEDQSSVCIPKPEPPDVPHSLDINYSVNSSAVEACRDDIVRRDKQTTISQPAPHVHTHGQYEHTESRALHSNISQPSDSMLLQVKQEDITIEEEGVS
ncbi:uncharacterized protein LOC110380706 isoform X2 [Helicoverpa armigera]|uniref:uncharacterized protein LOC110380706 isoform X2 n=1 Tax=Helicoverpa armigera TaxID=29058 RepID=UPI003082B0E6